MSNKDQLREVMSRHRLNYASLFGSIELCDCQHCRSIHSPAAYFVDLLQFIGPKTTAVTPLDVLIGNPDKKVVGRRPDLAHIKLSCENTNTTLPYVDLVNEALESYIVFDQTLPMKTDVVPPIPQPNESSAGATGGELAAEPEHTSDLAYEALEAAVFPCSLPFNQPLTSLRLTLEEMGSSRHEVMSAFRRDDGDAAGRAIDVEALKISGHEFEILTGEGFDGVAGVRPVSDFFGFETPAAPADTPWVAGAMPPGAVPQVVGGDVWAFTAFAPPPPSGAPAHDSAVAAGLHQHYFEKATAKLQVEHEDVFYTEIFIDPAQVPQQLMLQWNDGSWEHRAYWGASAIAVGVEGTASLRYMGPMPAAGVWVRLEVPAYFVGLSGRDVTGAAFTLFGGHVTWGAAGKRSPSWVESVSHVPTLLARTGLSYVDLISLLRTRFVNPALPDGEALAFFDRIPISFGVLSALVANGFAGADPQTVAALAGSGMTPDDLEAWATANFAALSKLIVLDAPDSACDLTLTRLQHLDGTALGDDEWSRLHRFVRLWRKSGWKVADLNRAFVALQATDITPTFLRQLGHIGQLQTLLKLPIQKLLVFWGSVSVTGDDALYLSLFKRTLQSDPVFALVSGEYLAASRALKIDENVPALLAGLRIRPVELERIRTDADLSGASAALTVATLSTIYRYVVLARALKVAVGDLIDLRVLSGEAPFSVPDPIATFKEIDPARTLRFVRLAERVKQSGFTGGTLKYIFSSLKDAPLNKAPSDDSIQLVLASIREGLARIAVENGSVGDPTGEVTRAKLTLVFEAPTVDRVAALVSGTQIYTAPLAALPAGVVLPPGGVVHDKGQLKASGWLSDTNRAALLALSADALYQAAVNSVADQPRELVNQALVLQLGWAKAQTDLQTSVLEPTSFAADGTVDTGIVAGKYTAFLAALLPHLRNRLSHALVRQALAEALGLDAATTALLLEGNVGKVLLGTAADKTRPIIDDFLALSGDGLTATTFANETLAAPSTNTRIDSSIDFQWDPNAGFSTRWEGWLLADKTQRYQFHLRAGGGVKLSLDGVLVIDQWRDGAPSEYTAAADLEAGKLYAIQIDYFNHASAAAQEPAALMTLRWSGPGSPSEIVPTARLYSKTRGDVRAAAGDSFVRLHKASLLINGFTLGSKEIGYLGDPTGVQSLNLNDLPVQAAPAAPRDLFTAWTRWNDFARLRALASDPPALLDAMTATAAAQAQAALVRAFGWESASVNALGDVTGFDLADADYQDVSQLLRLWDASRLLVLFEASPADAFAWAATAPNAKEARAAAQAARRVHKVQYDNDAWLEVSRPVTDRLRESQRAALVDYHLSRLGLADTSELFAYFLIDVEMSPCMLTSRIKQAISSVQLFIQRCRMSQEPQVDPKMISESSWRWMQNYRVWEANLRVFLYPENWIEPELRIDKSPFFRECESELLQEEITSDMAEAALGNYVEKVDRVSQLRIAGMYEQLDFVAGESRERVLHVFGRTFASPGTFYYRQLVTVNPNYRYWTAWEEVPLDIEADEVLPVIWNRRLYLFWEVQTETKDETQIRLAWSVYRNKKWSAKQLTAANEALTPSLAGEHRMDVQISGDELTVIFATRAKGVCMPHAYSIGSPSGPTTKAASTRHGSLTFKNYNGLAVAKSGSTKPTFHTDGFTDSASSTLEFHPVSCAEDAVTVLGRIPTTADLKLFAPGSYPYTLNDPFFLQQGTRSYLVVPQSPVAPSLLYDKVDDGTAFYLPSGKGAAAAAALNETNDFGPKFINSVELIRADPNPWSAGRAITTVQDIRLSGLAEKAESGGTISMTKESALFGYSAKTVAGLVPELATFRFETFFHPYTPEFQRRLNRYGVAGLLNLDSQWPAPVPSFDATYDPKPSVKAPLPVHDVDFSVPGAYSLYNWEIFFHIPLLIATRLGQNQRFEEAMRWFHYIFDPTAWSSGDPAPQRFWKVKPLREAQATRLDDLLKSFHAGDPNVLAQWEDLQANPFQPHRVARMRLVAYQKTVVMKYFDTAIAWADQLYRRDTIESINEATHLYVMVAILLGPRAQRLPPRGRTASKTFTELRSGLDELNQTIVQFENDLPFSSRATSGNAAEPAGLMGVGRSFYFCVPGNEKLAGYWDTIADRLFKIRHCMNIEGVVRDLALFEPQIDPALLVRAAAQGIDLGSVLGDMSAPLPLYRFTTLLAKALELTGELRALGSDLLATLEKRDAERLATLRTTHETELLTLVKQVKKQQLSEAQTAQVALEKTREVTQVRLDFYTNIVQRIAEETNQMDELAAAMQLQEEGQSAEGIASDIATFVPDIAVGYQTTPPNGTFSTTLGRGNVVAVFQAESREKTFEASKHSFYANRSAIEGGWKRRADDWKLQKDLAAKELVQIDKQIAGAELRVTIAQQELDNTTRQIEQSREVEEYLRTKFTNEELYSWRAGSVSTLFFQCYQMTYDIAKQAERSFRFDLGLTSSSFVSFGAWDSQRKGLLSGERLYLQLKQMERAYLDGNRRGYELTKHYSLAQNDPQAFVNLKATGQCEIELPEVMFDADYPGHFMRRIKTVSLTIPAVVGPYSSVNCTLTLLRDKTRIKSTVADDYPERDGEEDDRFVTNWARTQAIATSGGQNDSGMFELNFHDERYLPFEGAGVAGSKWRIEIDRDCNAFDVMTLPDVVLHIRYTASEGGGRLKAAAKSALAEAVGAEAGKPQARLFSLKHEFPTEWSQFVSSGAAAVGAIALGKDRFPFLFKAKTLTAGRLRLYAVLKDGAAPAAPLAVRVTPPGGTEERVEFATKSKWQGILAPKATPDVATEIKRTKAETTWALKTDSGDLAKHVDDLLFVFEYAVE